MLPHPAAAAPSTFADLVRSVRRRALFVLAAVAVAVVAAAAWAVRAPKQYRATASLLIERPLATDLGISSPFGAAQELDRFAATQLQVLRSRTVLDALEQRLDVSGWPEFAGLDGEARSGALADALEIEPRGQSALVDVGFVALDAQHAATLVNELCATYLSHVASREKEHVRNDLAAIESELPRLVAQREQARGDLDQFKKASASLTFDGREELLQEELKQQSRIVQEAREQQDDLEARCSIIDQYGVDADRAALARALDLEPSREAITKLVEFETRRAELAGLQGTRTAQLATLDAEIERLHTALAGEEQAAIAGLVLKLEIARKEVGHAEARLEQLRTTATELDRAKSEHDALASRVADATGLFDRLSQRRDELLVLEARNGTGSRIYVQDRASVPTVPCAPHRLAAIAIALVFGLLVGIAGALALERFDDRVGAIEELEASLETSSIARIPHLPLTAGTAPEYEWVKRPEAFPADEFRKLFLTLGGDQGTTDRARAITVLSAVPREGKTLVATGIAMAAARAGFSTLLIDGDLKRPRLHEVFSLESEAGVLDHLAGRSALEQVVHATRFDNLSLLPAGTPTPDLERLAHPRALARLVEQLRKGWQVIVFDTSPTLLSADAFVFARHADARVLVASAASSKVGPLRQAMAQLRHLGIEVAGTVINRHASPPAPYGAYDYTQVAGSKRRARSVASATKVESAGVGTPPER